jgi:divalent metal cation (Fe/Co/Zn/Cd) transporter
MAFTVGGAERPPAPETKQRAAALSVISNSALILLKLVARIVTGSVAILSAAIEGILILLGSAVIVFEAIRRLLDNGELHAIGFGIAVVAISMVVNLRVSSIIARKGRETDSPALEGDAAHLRTDAWTSAACWSGWCWCRSRARNGSTLTSPTATSN